MLETDDSKEKSQYTCYFAKKTTKNYKLNSQKEDLRKQNQTELSQDENLENLLSPSQSKKLTKFNQNKPNEEVFGLLLKDRRRHLYVLGKTGMGKSTMLQNIVLQDIFAGFGVCLIDPHGDSAEYILDRIPKHRHKDVIYLNPADIDFPIGLNVLESENGEPNFLVAAGLMSVFKRIWLGSWSSRMEYILNNTLLALLEINEQIAEINKEKKSQNRQNLTKNSQNKTQSEINLAQNSTKKETQNQKLQPNSRLFSSGFNKEITSQSSNQVMNSDFQKKFPNSKFLKQIQSHNKNPQDVDDSSFQNLDSNLNSSSDIDKTCETISDSAIPSSDFIPNPSSNLILTSQFTDIHRQNLEKVGIQTLLGVVKMLSDNDFCQTVVSCLKNPMVHNFWVREYANFGEKYRQEAVAPILNKIGQFFASSVVRNILGQTVSSLNFRTVMDKSQILLVNLSKGRLGDDNSNLLGSLIVNKLQLAAMTRVNVSENERQDFGLVVDEFQNFTSESFVSILSEARKYRLNLILAHQYIGQLEESQNLNLKNAIFGNVGSLVSFAVGARDARELVLEFGSGFNSEVLTSLGQSEIIAKLSINLQNMPSFVATTLPSIFEKFGGQKSTIISLSRQKWSNNKLLVENQIEQFITTDFGIKQISSSNYSKSNSPKINTSFLASLTNSRKKKS